MTFSDLVMSAIMVATAPDPARPRQDQHPKRSPGRRGAQALRRPLRQRAVPLGFIGSGLLAIPVLAGAGSVGMAGLLGKQWALSGPSARLLSSTALVALGTLGGTVLSPLHVNPIKLLVFVAVSTGWPPPPS